jgi:hypothetical protein
VHCTPGCRVARALEGDDVASILMIDARWCAILGRPPRGALGPRCAPQCFARQNGHMKTLDDMRQRRLLSGEQHARIVAWVAASDGPEAIMAMPADLWRALSLASVLMNIDADLTQPAQLGP